ncbi:MAG: hypothetical protein J6V05_01040 [Alistipes sp.]|nr:hypothetical protein [Alistipes sp.]
MKLFREHRGGLTESLATTIECPKGVQNIVKHYAYDARLMDVLIDPKPIRDDRLPKEWKGVFFYVYGLYSDDSRAVIGMSNFCDIPSVDDAVERAIALNDLADAVSNCIMPIARPIVDLINDFTLNKPSKKL